LLTFGPEPLKCGMDKRGEAHCKLAFLLLSPRLLKYVIGDHNVLSFITFLVLLSYTPVNFILSGNNQITLHCHRSFMTHA